MATLVEITWWFRCPSKFNIFTLIFLGRNGYTRQGVFQCLMWYLSKVLGRCTASHLPLHKLWRKKKPRVGSVDHLCDSHYLFIYIHTIYNMLISVLTLVQLHFTRKVRHTLYLSLICSFDNLFAISLEKAKALKVWKAENY